MEDKNLTLFENISTKPDHLTPRKPACALHADRPVPEIETTHIPFDNLNGRRIVVTGRLFQMEREEFALWLKDREATMQSSVSSHTDLLVVGENPGGVKVTEAKEFGISICYESEFFDKFGNQCRPFLSGNPDFPTRGSVDGDSFF